LEGMGISTPTPSSRPTEMETDAEWAGWEWIEKTYAIISSSRSRSGTWPSVGRMRTRRRRRKKARYTGSQLEGMGISTPTPSSRPTEMETDAEWAGWEWIEIWDVALGWTDAD
jgi:hypothetical protein